MAETAQTKLGRAVLSKASEPPPGRFAQAAAGARPFVAWRIPRLDLDVLITLLPANRVEEIEAAVFARMRDLVLDLNATTESAYELNRARRVCAEAFLDPTTKQPIGTPQEWADLIDADLLGDCWRAYGDVRATYDPVSSQLTNLEIAAIADAIKKKDPMLLRAYGVRRLATYLLTTAEQQSNSPEPRSGSGDSSPESSPSDHDAESSPAVTST